MHYQFHIADDHPLFRAALLDVIEQNFTSCSIIQSSDLEETLGSLKKNPDTDMLLLDINMPGTTDLYGLITIRKQFPDIPVVLVSAWSDIDIISRSMSHGASGFIPKSAGPEAISIAMKTILNGDYWVPDGMLGALNNTALEELSLGERLASLTPQQYRVLTGLKDGLLNKQIAFDMDITEATVKAHITAIFRKLEVSNRTQAVLILSKLSLMKSDH